MPHCISLTHKLPPTSDASHASLLGCVMSMLPLMPRCLTVPPPCCPTERYTYLNHVNMHHQLPPMPSCLAVSFPCCLLPPMPCCLIASLCLTSWPYKFHVASYASLLECVTPMLPHSTLHLHWSPHDASRVASYASHALLPKYVTMPYASLPHCNFHVASHASLPECTTWDSPPASDALLPDVTPMMPHNAPHSTPTLKTETGSLPAACPKFLRM